LIAFLVKCRDPFLFTSTNKLYNYVIQKNRHILSDELKGNPSVVSQDFNHITTVVDYLEKFYENLRSIVQENPSLETQDIIESLEERGFPYNTDSLQSKRHISSNEQGSDQFKTPVSIRENWKTLVDMKEKEAMVANEDYSKYSVFQTLQLGLEVLLSHWEYFCFFMLVVYQIQSQGLIMMIIPFALFGYALNEETRSLFRFWTFLFGFITFMIVAQFFPIYVKQHGNIDSMRDYLEMFCGLITPNIGFTFEIAMIIILLIQVTLIKKSGFDKGAESSIENINLAFMRKKLNNDLNETKKQLEDQKMLENEGDMTVRSAPEKLRKGSISVDNIFEEIEPEFVKALSKLPSKNNNNFFYRLFSFYNKKIGTEIYHLIAVVQLIIAAYIILFFSSMEDTQLNASITSSLKFNEFSGPMVIVLFLHIGVILIDRWIALINTNKEQTLDEYNFSLFAQKRRLTRGVRKSPSKADLNQPKSPKKSSLEKKSSSRNQGMSGKIMANLANCPELADEAFRSYSLFVKFILQISLLVILNAFFYLYLPSTVESPRFTSPSMTICYILMIIYFMLSSLQLKYGIPESTGRMVLMNQYSTFNSVCLKTYRAIPFFSEIKTFMDWTFTTTSLDLFQWLKLEEVYCELFSNKVSSEKRFKRRLGERIDKVSKFSIGCLGILGFILLVMGPMLLFSTYNPIGKDNFVIGAKVDVGFKFGNNYFNIYSNSHVSTIQPVQDLQIPDKRSLTQDLVSQTAVRGVDYNKIQYVTMASFSEQLWNIARPNYEQIQNDLTDLLTKLQNVNTTMESLQQTNPANIQISVQFLQSQLQLNNIAPTASLMNHNLYKNFAGETLKKEELQALLNRLLNITNCQKDSFKITKSYDSLMRVGTQQAPANVSDSTHGFNFYQDLNIEFICPNVTTLNDSSLQIANGYWRVYTAMDTNTNQATGIVFYVITNKVSSYLLSFSITAFYIGIVFVIGNVVKRGLSGQIFNLTLDDLPAAGEIIQICEGILIARADKNLIKEERLYWELIDILRSPEVVKLITKSSVQEKLERTYKLKMD